MSVLSRAKDDWKRHSQSSFDLNLEFATDDGSQAGVIKGIGTNVQVTFETDGQEAIGHMVHIGFNERLLKENSPSYPIRNDDGIVSINNHRVSFLDSTDTKRNYVIKQVYPDSTVGMIMCDCGDFIYNGIKEAIAIQGSTVPFESGSFESVLSGVTIAGTTISIESGLI